MRLLFCILFPCLYLSQEANIQIKMFWKDQPLILDQPLSLDSNQSLQIQSLKFYISSNNKDSIVHLIDFQESTSTYFKNYSQKDINFNIGLDSLQNEQTNFSGALDPIHGMYWAWNTGYIHFKLVGTIGKQKFEFHIGGFKTPFQTLQSISFSTQRQVNYLKIDLFPLLNYAFSHKIYLIMSPGNDAKTLAGLLPSLFSVVYE